MRGAFYFTHVTEKETLKIVKALPSKKAPGADKVTARILKASLPVTLPRLFFNFFYFFY